MKYELAIVGGGPAGVSAGIYAARKKIKTILIAESFGGQSLTSLDIQNWIGTKSVTGLDLAKMLEEHLRAQEGIDIKEGARVESIQKSGDGFKLALKNNEVIETKYLLLANGSHRKKLGVPGERELDGRGVAYCSTCDAPVFAGKTIAIVGGGNSALEGVRDSLPYASKIYLIARGDHLRGDPISQEKAKNSDKVEIIYNAEIQEILGDLPAQAGKMVTGLKYKDKKGGEIKALKLDGVFVEIGSVPNSDLAKEMPGIKLNNYSEIIVDHKTQVAAPGVWAAGDVADVLYKQNNISAGDAVKAVLNIYDTLHSVKRI
ncbi:MAG: FAD-dependent oxidoreductase [Candidatus Liptonbacteria bacterium]|nr:FAD-dependent oxidoreductase [Candidatus Liptonbacteria bacterium]